MIHSFVDLPKRPAVTAEQIVANVQDETPSVQQSAGSTDAVVPPLKSFFASWAQLLPEAASKLERRVSAPASASLPASPLCAEFDVLFADPQRFDLSYRFRIEASPLVEPQVANSHAYVGRLRIRGPAVAFAEELAIF